MSSTMPRSFSTLSSKPSSIARAMHSATRSMSSSLSPLVVTAGVPSRRPLVTKGLRYSPGTVFLLAVIYTSSSLRSSSLPVSSSPERSTSIR